MNVKYSHAKVPINGYIGCKGDHSKRTTSYVSHGGVFSLLTGMAGVQARYLLDTSGQMRKGIYPVVTKQGVSKAFLRFLDITEKSGHGVDFKDKVYYLGHVDKDFDDNFVRYYEGIPYIAKPANHLDDRVLSKSFLDASLVFVDGYKSYTKGYQDRRTNETMVGCYIYKALADIIDELKCRTLFIRVGGNLTLEGLNSLREIEMKRQFIGLLHEDLSNKLEFYVVFGAQRKVLETPTCGFEHCMFEALTHWNSIMRSGWTTWVEKGFGISRLKTLGYSAHLNKDTNDIFVCFPGDDKPNRRQNIPYHKSGKKTGNQVNQQPGLESKPV